MAARGLTRDRLVAIAHGYVTEHGLDALTMRRLAVAAGVSPGAIYKHFRDQRDLRRAMADAVYATIDLSDIDTDRPTAEQVIACCMRMRAAMLQFRDGGRIVAGSYSPFAATAALGATLRTLLHAIALPSFDAGNLAYVLRNFTVGFVIEEQAYLGLVANGEWDSLIQMPPGHELVEPDGVSDAITILGDNRDQRFRAGIEAILAGTVA
ncbi:TetR/AcrR family transcriptional regulator [Rhodococcus sp. TAF43]|uniref:TetR/AcrR family transcriptional regulator n=1 Tax=unclassified Rhodococcus (in: high G+C Gram-positive bacteria) TaxID=192944 RepID=UPI001582783A|nr:TetR/AcrR family transcriptional regulator [Rhodococcus sp. W8901]QKT11907.1 TetR/AcrR family transcriptional regulator [Rhodococcus sp. W8901]